MGLFGVWHSCLRGDLPSSYLGRRLAKNRRGVDQDLFYGRIGRNVKHQIAKKILHDHAKGSGSRSRLFCFFCNCIQGGVGKGERDSLFSKKSDVLLDDRIFGLGENFDKILFGQLIAVGNAVETSRKFGKLKEVEVLKLIRKNWINKQLTQINDCGEIIGVYNLLCHSIHMNQNGSKRKSARNRKSF